MGLKSKWSKIRANNPDEKKNINADALLANEYGKQGKFQRIVSLTVDALTKIEVAKMQSGMLNEGTMRNEERKQALFHGAQYFASQALNLKRSDGLLALQNEMNGSPYWDSTSKGFNPSDRSGWDAAEFKSAVKQAMKIYQEELCFSKSNCLAAIDSINKGSRGKGIIIISITADNALRSLRNKEQYPTMSLNSDEYRAFSLGETYFVAKALGLDQDPTRANAILKMRKDLICSGYWKDSMLEGLTPTSKWGLHKDDFKSAAELAIRTCGTMGSDLIKEAKISPLMAVKPLMDDNGPKRTTR